MSSQTRELPADALSDSAVDSFNSRTGAVTPVAEDYSADQITNVPAGGVAADNVQDAVNELDTEKVAKAFTPSVALDWDGPPTTVQAALDELAARLRAIE